MKIEIKEQQNMLEKIEEMQMQNQENLSKFEKFKSQVAYKFRKHSYPISWNQFFLINESQLNAQIFFGYIRQLFIPFYQLIWITHATSDSNCNVNLQWGWQSILFIISMVGCFPQLYMCIWFLNKHVFGQKNLYQPKLDIVQYLKNSFRVPMCLLTIANVYTDIYSIFVC